MSVLKSVAAEVRAIAVREARRSNPPLERFKVLRKNPVLLESYSTGNKLTEGDEDFEITRGIRKKLKVGEDVLVATERDGDRIIMAASSGATGADPDGGATGEAEEEEEPDAESAIQNEGVGMVFHGENENEPRPTSFAHYIWIGSVEPRNATDLDFMVITS